MGIAGVCNGLRREGIMNIEQGIFNNEVLLLQFSLFNIRYSNNQFA